MESSNGNKAPTIDSEDSEPSSPVDFGIKIEVVADRQEDKEEVKDVAKDQANKDKLDSLNSLPTIAKSEIEKH